MSADAAASEGPRAALAALAEVWGPSTAPGRTHAAWRRVGQAQARAVCDAFVRGSDADRDAVRSHVAGWFDHLLNFAHAEAEDAVRSGSPEPVRRALLVCGLAHGQGDPRDVLLVLAPVRRACRLVKARPRDLIGEIAPALGPATARWLTSKAGSGATSLGLRFSAWREKGEPAERVFEMKSQMPDDPEQRRALTENSLAGVEGAFAEEMRFALDPDPGPPPARLPRPSERPGPDELAVD
jgi:hypothetical protein